MTASNRTRVGAGSGRGRTPPDLFDWLNRRFQFDYDAFASHENALRDLHSTTEGTFCASGWADADRTIRGQLFVSELTGLEYDWSDLHVYMNPPYSRGLINDCVRKAWSERNKAAIIVALLPAATETHWFQDYILPWCHIDWLPKRIEFIDPVTLPSGMVIATFKDDLRDFS